MNRVHVEGANDGGVAYSKARVIPWKKRIDEGFYKQRGGGFNPSEKRWRRNDMTGNQRGGSWFDGLSQGMFGIKQTRGRKTRQNYAVKQQNYAVKRKKPVRKQKGGSWFDGLSQGMFGIKQTRGKKKREPAVIHSAKRSYPQKGGRYGFKGFFENPFGVKEKLGGGKKGKKQKGGVLGLGKFEKWYGGKSKKQQGEIDAWAAKNLKQTI
jgi:hypothetical protein